MGSGTVAFVIRWCGSNHAPRTIVLMLAVGMALACTAISTPTPTPTTVPTLTPMPTPIPTLEPWVPRQEIAIVQLDEARFHVLVADTSELRAQGLSDRDDMPREWGMWFDFGSPQHPSFWMRGMLFPIDIIWIDEELRVVHVTHEAPVPLPDTIDSLLPRFNAGGTYVRYVLEVGAGLARELDIGPGVTVTVE